MTIYDNWCQLLRQSEGKKMNICGIGFRSSVRSGQGAAVLSGSRKVLAGVMAGALALAALFVNPTPTRAAGATDKTLLQRQARSWAELAHQVDMQIAVAPGGKRVGSNEVEYRTDGPGGKSVFVVTFALPGAVTAAAADCPAGWFCFYEYTNFGYPRGKLSSQGWQDLATYGWHDRTESVHNRTSTTVGYNNHARDHVDHNSDWQLFTNTSGGAISDLFDHKNKVDHVHRY